MQRTTGRAAHALTTLPLLLFMTLPLQAQQPAPRDVVGTWTGSLSVGGTSLRIVFHIQRSNDVLRGTLDSPDQGAFGIPVARVEATGDSVKLIVPSVSGEYAGSWSADGLKIEGRWQQGGMSFPLVLERGEAEAPRRPQHPVAPFPYEVHEVTFPNASAGITLAGTLTVPRGVGPHPAVVLISGSGPQDRDETVFAHKPFLVLADHLTRNGIAVLRYDDRGVGQSTGAFGLATTADFATDALAAVAFLKSRDEVDPARIGLAGHSEGGLIAPRAAADSRDVAFVILLAGPGVSGEEILKLQAAKILRANGAGDDLVVANRGLQERIFAALKANADADSAAVAIRAAMRAFLDELEPAQKTGLGFGGDGMDAAIETQVRTVNSPWFRHFLVYDPAPALARLAVPVLALNGANDLQVPPEQNLPAIEAALRRGGNPDATVREMPSLNHLFQTAQTGSPAEYQRIEETFAPAALDAITEWIRARFAR